MPVPVPRLVKPPSHPVIKNKNSGNGQPVDFQSLSNSLPPCPAGRPPSFGTREEWINSLSSWRGNKPRRIWEDDHPPCVDDSSDHQGFQHGLTAAANASVIKGTHAEACIPPLYTLLHAPTFDQFALSRGCVDDEDEDMGSDSSVDYSHLDNQSQWTASSPLQDIEDIDLPPLEQQQQRVSPSQGSRCPPHERGAFSPVYEDRSPDDPSSSPLEPVTPFGLFVDRAVAEAQPYVLPACTNNALPMDGVPSAGAQSFGNQQQKNAVRCNFEPFTVGDPPKEPVPAVDTVTPSISADYKKLAEPLAQWVADYVWKVCTTGLSLPLPFVSQSYQPFQYAPSPPAYLAVSVHSLLLSTLLQPSAVFLAIWYIIRLPVQFAPVTLGPEFSKEACFRAALLGDPHFRGDSIGLETSAPFRLIVLGCMLANKWLDDHTFSNKTWHSISNVPIHVLNQLETLALDTFSYDLSVPISVWSQWLEHILSYHKSLSSPGHPQPISRPSSSPHGIIRKTIEEVMTASKSPDLFGKLPQPVFIGLEERRRARLEKEMQVNTVLDINLDEDGPLREEYIPKRRASTVRTVRSIHPDDYSGNLLNEKGWDHCAFEPAKNLPPPAKWSPAGDEPILRERNRSSGHYVAVQPTPAIQYPLTYQRSHDAVTNHNWNAVTYMPIKPQQGYVYDLSLPPSSSQHSYNYPFAPSIPLPHSRSQSLSLSGHDNLQMHNHVRSHSQSVYERCSGIRMTVNDLGHLEAESCWGNEYNYPSAAPPFGAMPAFQTAWLRT